MADVGALISLMTATSISPSHYLKEEKQTLYNLIKSISVVNIVTEEERLLSSCNKVKHFLEDETKGQYMFTSVHDLLNNYTLVLPEWRNSSKNILVVAFDDKCERFNTLCMNICEILSNNDKKKLILVSKTGNIVTSEFRKFGVGHSQFVDDDKYHKNFPLHRAAAQGNLNEIKEYMDKYPNTNPNNRDFKGRTPFYCAAAEGEIRAMEYLTQLGVDFGAPNVEGWTPLHYASASGSFPTIEFLLNVGIDINLQTIEGDTSLHLAAGCGQVQVIMYLLEKGASINAWNLEGSTPLHEAVWRGQIEACQVLIENGCDVHIANKKGFTTLHWAAFFGHLTAVVSLLDKGADINAKTNSGYTPLHGASECDQFDIVQHLLSRGAAINIRNMSGNTPLHCAARWGKIDTVICLLKNGADIRATNGECKTPFDLACGLTKIEMARYLKFDMGCLGI